MLLVVGFEHSRICRVPVEDIFRQCEKLLRCLPLLPETSITVREAKMQQIGFPLGTNPIGTLRFTEVAQKEVQYETNHFMMPPIPKN